MLCQSVYEGESGPLDPKQSRAMRGALGAGQLSNSDSFIGEVSEEVRRDKLFALFRRYGWIGLVAILALVVATAWNEFQSAKVEARDAAFGDAMLEALDAGDTGARDAALAGIPAADGQQVIRALAQASDPMAGRAEALAALDGLIGQSDLNPVYRDLAVLRRMLILGPEMPAPDRNAALADLSVAGRPYAPVAREMQALALVEAGDTAGAIAAFSALVGDSSSPQGTRSRASALINALGGVVDAPAATGG
jgi:hypothetical protein